MPENSNNCLPILATIIFQLCATGIIFFNSPPTKPMLIILLIFYIGSSYTFTVMYQSIHEDKDKRMKRKVHSRNESNTFLHSHSIKKFLTSKSREKKIRNFQNRKAVSEKVMVSKSANDLSLKVFLGLFIPILPY